MYVWCLWCRGGGLRGVGGGWCWVFFFFFFGFSVFVFFRLALWVWFLVCVVAGVRRAWLASAEGPECRRRDGAVFSSLMRVLTRDCTELTRLTAQVHAAPGRSELAAAAPLELHDRASVVCGACSAGWLSRVAGRRRAYVLQSRHRAARLAVFTGGLAVRRLPSSCFFAV